jgi:hypothetical protein
LGSLPQIRPGDVELTTDIRRLVDQRPTYLTSSPTGFPNPHVPERRFRYQLPHDALAELQKSLDAGEQHRFYFPTKTPGRWRHHLGGCRLTFIEET